MANYVIEPYKNGQLDCAHVNESVLGGQQTVFKRQ